MKFICNGATLAEAVMKVSKACAVRTTAPVMECIKLEASGEEITLLATDGELAISKTIKAEIFEEGAVCVPGKIFADYIGKLTEEEVSVGLTDKGLEIRYKDASSCLQTISAAEFPKLNLEIGENSVALKQGDLKRIIAETVFCCAQDDSRPILKGCLLEFKDRLTAFALDGYRLALADTAILSKSTEMTVICPARTLTEISRMLFSDDEEITIYTEGGMLLVRTEDMTILSRLYSGDFIKRENVIPSRFTTVATLSRQELISGVERAAILIRGDKNNLITFEIGNGLVKVSSVSDLGNMTECVNASIEGVDTTISMNAKYLLDALKALGEESVTISFNGPVSPFVLQNAEQKGALYLILPVRNAQ